MLCSVLLSLSWRRSFTLIEPTPSLHRKYTTVLSNNFMLCFQYVKVFLQVLFMCSCVSTLNKARRGSRDTCPNNWKWIASQPIPTKRRDIVPLLTLCIDCTHSTKQYISQMTLHCTIYCPSGMYVCVRWDEVDLIFIVQFVLLRVTHDFCCAYK